MFDSNGLLNRFMRLVRLMSGASKARVSPCNTARNCRAETCPTPVSDADLPSSAFRNSPSNANRRFKARGTSSDGHSDAGFGPLQWFVLRGTPQSVQVNSIRLRQLKRGSWWG